MPFAIRVRELGGPEKLLFEEVEKKSPGLREVLVKNKSVGLNFVDTYYRTGLYPIPLPFVPGSEGAGIVEAVGPKVKQFKVGDRVAYADPIGAYSEYVLRPEERLIKIPSFIDFNMAAAIMLKGMTAQYLLRRTFKVKRGDTILVHAAAGGVGQILCPWANYLGATVIGTVGSQEKVKIAKKAGCKKVIVSTVENVPEEVRKFTKGKGVQVVYDSVGKDTFLDSLDCLAPLGLMVSYGNASGAVLPFEIATLAKKGSLFLTRPTLGTYVTKSEDLQKSAQELFSMVKKGVVKVSINQKYSLKNASQAHSELEGRMTTGSSVFVL